MKYYIRTTLERKLDSSYNQIEYELLVDRERKPLKSLIKQYKYISNEDCVLLEDDLILCKDFKSSIEKVISEYPDRIINFFFNPMRYITPFNATNFAYSQCRYYPKGITDKIAEYLETRYTDANRTAKYVTEACRNLGYTVFQYRPCLVQHLDNVSLLGIERKDRRSPYFIDYLEELGISYEEAKLPENKTRLTELMYKKFNKK